MSERARITGHKKPVRVVAGREGELGLLARIRAQAGDAATGRDLRLGIGDDCALLRVRTGEELAVTTDFSISGRHFELAWHPPEAIGHRTLARGLSDLAAMGARPVAAFLSLGLPKALGRKRHGVKSAARAPWIDRFFDGLFALARAFETPLAGGDLAESPVAVADIILLGAVGRGKAMLRSGAYPGDLIYVTGSLGGAAAGLEILKKLAKAQKRSSKAELKIPAKLEAALATHLYPQPRVEQGLWLARRGVAAAAIDISDGLSTDLRHLCEESGVAAEIEAEALPVATRRIAGSGAPRRRGLRVAVHGAPWRTHSARHCRRSGHADRADRAPLSKEIARNADSSQWARGSRSQRVAAFRVTRQALYNYLYCYYLRCPCSKTC